MIVSQTAEYGLRALVWLADRAPTPQTTQQIAAATRVPAGYLSKVLQALRKAGIVRAQRGLHGGFVLAVPPAALTVLDAVNAIDPIGRIRSCPLGIPSHDPMLCPLHHALDQAMATVEEAFAKVSIADLAQTPADHRPFCLRDMPTEARP